jgi:dolichol-phosphate mannosyltransferase
LAIFEASIVGALSANLVIIPTYNEKENIQAIIQAVFALPEGFEVLVVDDNSPDGTGTIVQNLQKQHPDALHLLQRQGKSGLGTAYLAGFGWALERDYQFIFEMDADFSHNPEDLPRLLEACREEGADLAIGSRYSQGVNVVNWPMGRVLLSYFASRYVRFVTGMPIEDTTAGFKCYRRRVLETIRFHKIQFVGYAFQIEMKFKAWLYGFKVVEVPVIFTDRRQGESKMSGSIIREAVLGVIEMKIRSLIDRKNYR